jgi:putative membrane protein
MTLSKSTVALLGAFVAGLMTAVAVAGLATSAAAQAPRRPPGAVAAANFAAAASQASQYEIEAAHAAQAESQNPRVQAFAQQMIEAHTRAQAAIRQAAAASGLTPPPPAMSSDQASLLAALQGVRGADFDRLYARQQILAHQQALAVEQSYASVGTDPNLRRAAQADVPMIQHHLEMAQNLASGLGES